MATNRRIGIPVNLPTGATYELLLLDYADSYPEGKIDFKLNDTPRKITGIQKVAQIFLKVLFSTRGTDVLNPTYGTLFTNYTINANRTGVDRDLYIGLITEIKDAERQTIAITNQISDDDASKLSQITILGLDTAKESIIMYLKIQTAAGELAQVAVPFPQLDMTLSSE